MGCRVLLACGLTRQSPPRAQRRPLNLPGSNWLLIELISPSTSMRCSHALFRPFFRTFSFYCFAVLNLPGTGVRLAG